MLRYSEKVLNYSDVIYRWSHTVCSCLQIGLNTSPLDDDVKVHGASFQPQIFCLQSVVIICVQSSHGHPLLSGEPNDQFANTTESPESHTNCPSC